MSYVRHTRISGGSGKSSGIARSDVTMRYRVYGNSRDDNTLTLSPGFLAALGVSLYSAHPNNSAFTLREVNFDHESDGPNQSVFIASLVYKTDPVSKEQKDKEQNPNPLNRAAVINWDSQNYDKLITTDNAGLAIMTSAGELFPATAIDDARWIVSVEKNYAAIPSWVLTSNNKVNSDEYVIDGVTVLARKSKTQNLAISEELEENGVTYRRISLEIAFREEGWADEKVDAGFYYINGSGEYVKQTDASGQEVKVEGLLDGSGGQLIDIVPNPAPGDESYITSDVYKEMVFAGTLPGCTAPGP